MSSFSRITARRAASFPLSRARRYGGSAHLRTPPTSCYRRLQGVRRWRSTRTRQIFGMAACPRTVCCHWSSDNAARLHRIRRRATAPTIIDAPLQEIRMSIDEVGKRVVFERWGEIKGVGAELLIALAAPFREAREDELPPERYPYLTKAGSRVNSNCESDEVLRRRVLRCRNAINEACRESRRP